jgi:nucleotide-binding universal stress UspA family protein
MSNVDTSATTGDAIVVGVGNQGQLSEGTLAFVVDTATRLDLGIELVHVVPTLVGGPTGTWEVGVTFDQLLAEGWVRLDEAVERVRSRVGARIPVSAHLLRGGVTSSLVDRSRHAQLVVLERRHLGRWERLAEGSVTSGVAARAHAPVVSVPEGWLPSSSPRPITVAVEDAKRADAEVWTALGLAAATDLPVQILRVAYLPEAYQEILRREANEDDLLRQARDGLVHDTRLPASVCERVPCTFVVRWGRPVEVLVDASAGSSLLVLGRRDPHLPVGSHLGPIVRHVLREAHCPVMVVEPKLAAPVWSEPAAAEGREERPLASASSR